MKAIENLLANYLPVSLLIGIALIQIYRFTVFHQPAWKGGGFGMFATTDSTSARNLSITLIKNGKVYSGQDALQVVDYKILQDLRFQPSLINFEKLVGKIHELNWYDPLLEEKLRLGNLQKDFSHWPSGLLVPRARKTDSVDSHSTSASAFVPSMIDIKLYHYNFKNSFQNEGFFLTNNLLFQTRRKFNP